MLTSSRSLSGTCGAGQRRACSFPQQQQRGSWAACRAVAQQARRSVTGKQQQARQSDDDELDTAALVKYVGAVTLQTGLMTGALWGMQQATDALTAAGQEDAPRALIGIFFLLISLRSRIFSPLDASRPTIKGEKSAIMQRQRPSWMPPPPVFPIVWSLIALLRTTSSLMVWEGCGQQSFALPLVAFCCHLAIGDCWNHINNQEKRLGVAVPGVLACLGSCVAVVATYWQVDAVAGQVLAPSAVWISVASALIASIWDLNRLPDGDRAPLLPTKGESREVAAALAAAAASAAAK